MAPFVGVVEILFGALLLLGLFTRLSAIPLTIDILVAIATTKLPMLVDGGLWKMAHEARVDWSMLLGLICLFLVGGGRWSLDEQVRAGSGMWWKKLCESIFSPGALRFHLSVLMKTCSP